MEKIDKCDLLIVDDEPGYRLFLEDFFKQRMPGVKIKLAKDGEEAYNLALKFKPRIIWTCIKMPSLDGLKLIELIKKNPDIRNAKIIMYTGYHSEKIKNEAFKLGADAFLPKGEYGQLEEGLKIVTNFLK
jgi:YesN/AraC family two-component response regulator